MILNLNFNGNKIRVYLERPSDFVAFVQVFVEKSYPNLISKINKGDTIIDAGANIGMFSIIASILVGKTGKVIAIEPDPENLKILKRNIELNNLDNIIIVDKALYLESGKKINLRQDGILSGISTDDNSGPKKGIKVETITLDDVISGLSLKPKFLKMDIEGGERFALLRSHVTFKTISYFEGEIHSLEDYNVLLQYSDSFAFKRESTKVLRTAVNFSLKHPLMAFLILNRIIKFLFTHRTLIKHIARGTEEYPVIVYCQRLVEQ